VIAVTFALPAESQEFLRSLGSKSQVNRNGIRTIRGRSDHHAIEVLHTGVGEKVCRQRVAKFLEEQHFNYLISAGFAGALSDDLQIGDLLLAKNFSKVELSETPALLSGSPIHIADLLTVPALIHSREERNKLGLTSGAAAADMETEFIAHACSARGIPLLSLRVISDTPHHLFPVPANVLFDIERQQTRISKLATHLLANPGRVPHLVRFAKQIARARRILASALADVLRALPERESPT